MANLKGGSFDKQLKDAFHRVEALGTPKEKNDHLTHSVALATKRVMYGNDIKNHFLDKGITEGKLNQLLTDKEMDSMLSNRLDGLATETKEAYLRGLSSYLQGLEANNITIHVDKEYFDEKVAEVKFEDNFEKEIANRYIENLEEKQFDRVETQLFVDVGSHLGLRASETMELMKNPETYLVNGEVVGLCGKGNHTYEPKSLPEHLEAKLMTTEVNVSLSTIRRDLKEENIVPHDLRFTYARNEYNKLIEEGKTHDEARAEVSQELNHRRLDITDYYLKRT